MLVGFGGIAMTPSVCESLNHGDCCCDDETLKNERGACSIVFLCVINGGFLKNPRFSLIFNWAFFVFFVFYKAWNKPNLKALFGCLIHKLVILFTKKNISLVLIFKYVLIQE
jgi:hypothetical protein